MQKLQCEICGSVDIVKSGDNLFECQCCGCKYTLEQVRYLVRDTVTVKQPDFVIQAGKLVKYCGASTNVKIPGDVSVIGKSAFSECSALNSVVIPEGVISIETGAFSGCSSLKSITIPESVSVIEGYAFSECKSLTEISMPSGITEIEFGVFSECSSLLKVKLPKNLAKIKRDAFLKCHSIKEIIIPASVIEIDREAFYDCPNLENVVLPQNTNLSWGNFSGTKWYLLQREKLEKQRQIWKQQNLCSNCGGRFKGIFDKVCVQCGCRKNY